MSGPPVDLTPDAFADDLYSALDPVAGEDDDNAWALLILCNAIGVMYQMVDDWVRDQPEGPGWSLLLDLGRCPSEALGWLGQFVGVRIPVGLTDAQQRAWIASMPGFRRGTPAAMIGAAQPTLTGGQSVTLIERDGDPYYLTVTTKASETPSMTNTRAALLTQKPAGIVLNYGGGGAPQTWGTLKAKNATWATALGKYGNWSNALYANPPT